MTGVFNSRRLTVARKRRKFTARALAEAVSVSPVTITRLEKGENCPEQSTVESLSKALNFPLEFFFGEDVDELAVDAASFRSLSSMTAKERDAALAAGTLAYIFHDWVAARFNLPEVDIPHLRGEAGPEAAAQALREKWGLGLQPIPNMIRLLEAKGARIFSLCEDTKSVDAFSCWRNNQAFVFLNTFKSAERSRFDAAHELGHLVLHKHGAPQDSRQAENEADQFASTFLMPTEDVLSRIRRVSTIGEVIAAKRRWGVSVGALTYRLNKLGIISEWQNRSFNIEISRRGFRTEEPNGLARESSVVWPKVLAELWQERISRSHIARQLHLPESEIDQLLFQLTGQITGDAGLYRGLKLVS
ncbi:helix-turn-helix domain-containing protein [Eoetvoesiella caeni]|uniref:Zn-dependent peptidase ImmA (M78 family) n=1 Tax=Eoetvoesiella caeni TaxID=645616 RepID=A0A366H0I6_9BURK|nr:XRE family transcriptional regulator [Eoetvoesiella caeni]MCI2811194.1 XRE family transcriptional regulator [Eoetvoesiella caeni]NYT57048.1 ImmA/IrrE family metallo-endopeptidase [Eoetvoesiella caeni]RBP35007.1 Zn-dependent peptidase ImmA (M78 family) [Eoetvoesiella caeni]